MFWMIRTCPKKNCENKLSKECSELHFIKIIFVRFHRRDTPANFGYYDFVDYESADDQDQDQNNDALYFNENTQIVDNAYSDNGYEADESLMSADKRSRHPVSNNFIEKTSKVFGFFSF